MILFLLLNGAIFAGSLFLAFGGALNFGLITTLPFVVQGIIIAGMMTVLFNLYDSIKNFVVVFTAITTPTKEEDED